MWLRVFGFGLVAALLALGTGCKKKAEPAEKPQSRESNAPPPAAVSAADTVARVHWLGKKRLAAETNAASFMEIWNLPESTNLETQTLDKLAVAPWHPWTTNQAPITNYPSLISNLPPAALLRPLLQDLVQEESYLEIRQATNQPRQSALAIRLDDQRAAVWETNLAAVVESLAGLRPLAARTGTSGWQLQFTNRQSPIAGQIELARAGEWTVIGMGQAHNPVLAEVLARIQRDHAPFGARATNFWLEAEFDLRLVVAALAPNLHLPENLPRVFVTLVGDGKSVLTHGQLDFPRPLPLEMEPWMIPTNLIHDPLIGFMAIRGIRPLLKSFQPWNDLGLGTPPNQAFFWAQRAAPSYHFMALPSAQASNQVSALTEFVMKDVNPILASNKMKLGTFVRATNDQRMVWKGMPLLAPTLDSAASDGAQFIVGGFFFSPLSRFPFPSGLLAQVYSSTNLVLYDWEITQMCSDGMLQNAQLIRQLFSRADLSRTSSLLWLRAISRQLGNSATAVHWIGPTRFSFSRNSSMGLTGIELQFLADWLESPRFPRGLHATLAPPPPPLRTVRPAIPGTTNSGSILPQTPAGPSAPPAVAPAARP